MAKLLIWDADNTLWNGTIAEGDTPTLPPGRLELCQELSERGVLQSIASHNLPEDIAVALHRLGLDSFFMFNRAEFGKRKSLMIREIVQDYELSRMSDVVFLDDDPFNRAEVRQALPEVRVQMPEEVDAVVATYFTKAHYTEEDRLRVRRYQSEQQRRQASRAYGDDHQAFLRSCNLVVTISQAKEEDLPRIIDLATRANRMAAMVRVYTPDELAQALHHTWVCRVRDTFGDYGLSAFLIAPLYVLGSLETSIDAFVVSCRLQGRGVGSALLGWYLNRSINLTVRARWMETEYNAGMRALYEWYRFALEPALPLGPGPVSAELQVKELVSLPDWLKIEAP